MNVSTHGVVLVLVLVVASGCSPALPSWVPLVRSREDAAGRSASAPGPAAGPARRPMEVAVREADAEALYQLGLAQADPTSGARDYRVARATFTRLLVEFPRSRRDAEARAWQATLTDLLVREDEAHRYAQRVQRLEEERKRTKSAYEWLKQTDLDREPRR